MKIIKGAIAALAEEGYLTLQVPDLAVGECDFEELPDEWFCRWNYGKGPAIGRESGMLYLTRAGYEANKQELKAAFSGDHRGYTWKDFESHVELHFAETQRHIDRRLADFRRKIRELESFKV